MVLSFFSRMRESRKQKALAGYGNVLKNKVTTKEQRLEAIEALLEYSDAELVIPQLMKRFSIAVDSGIQDKREKEICAEKILSFADAAKPFVRHEVVHGARVSWPLQMSEKLFSPDEYLDLLLEVAQTSVAPFDDTANQRRVEVVLALKEIVDGRIVDAVRPFLEERDESLRMAALECLEKQAETDERAREMIVGLLSKEESDDNSRFLGVVRSLAAKNGWKNAET